MAQQIVILCKAELYEMLQPWHSPLVNEIRLVAHLQERSITRKPSSLLCVVMEANEVLRPIKETVFQRKRGQCMR